MSASAARNCATPSPSSSVASNHSSIGSITQSTVICADTISVPITTSGELVVICTDSAGRQHSSRHDDFDYASGLASSSGPLLLAVAAGKSAVVICTVSGTRPEINDGRRVPITTGALHSIDDSATPC